MPTDLLMDTVSSRGSFGASTGTEIMITSLVASVLTHLCAKFLSTDSRFQVLD